MDKPVLSEGDRELLELAAKADGRQVIGFDERSGCLILDSQHRWNPLIEDADAFRLAVKLQLTVCNEHLRAGSAYSYVDDSSGNPQFLGEVLSGHDAGRIGPFDYADTRRAIVISAAEIGRNMEVSNGC